MVGEARGPDRPRLVEWLEARGRRLSFHEVVGLLEQMLPGDARVGGDGPPQRESIRLRCSVSLAFPSTEVEGIDLDSSGRLRVTSNFLGLLGASSPLPSRYVERVAQLIDEREGERVRAFLDVIHHRFYGLLYRAWSKYWVGPSPSGVALWARLLGLAGLEIEQPDEGAAAQPQSATTKPRSAMTKSQSIAASSMDFDPRRLLASVQRVPTAAGLERLLESALGMKVELSQFERRTAVVPLEERSSLGGRHAVVGSSLMLGTTISDRNLLRISVVATTPEMFDALSPDGAMYRRIEAVLGSYLTTPIDHDLSVTVHPQAARTWRIGTGRLGCGLWLGGVEEASSVRFELCRRAREKEEAKRHATSEDCGAS